MMTMMVVMTTLLLHKLFKLDYFSQLVLLLTKFLLCIISITQTIEVESYIWYVETWVFICNFLFLNLNNVTISIRFSRTKNVCSKLTKASYYAHRILLSDHVFWSFIYFQIYFDFELRLSVKTRVIFKGQNSRQNK
jgi:hypothetical protein